MRKSNEECMFAVTCFVSICSLFSLLFLALFFVVSGVLDSCGEIQRRRRAIISLYILPLSHLLLVPDSLCSLCFIFDNCAVPFVSFFILHHSLSEPPTRFAIAYRIV